jgi:hypothetical protein
MALLRRKRQKRVGADSYQLGNLVKHCRLCRFFLKI